MKLSQATWIPALFLAGLLGTPLAASQHMSPPAFADIDTNGDGMIDPEEFAQHQAARMAERHGGQTGQGHGKRNGEGQGQGKGQGKGQGQGEGQGHQAGKGQGHGQGAGRGRHVPPAHGELDLDDDGCIDEAEFARHVAERHGGGTD